MQTEEMRLDGNAAAGILRELFARDMTTAMATCRGCGSSEPLGKLLDYGHGMGAILRCLKCEAVLLRVVHVRDTIRLDASGTAVLSIGVGTVVG